jgi:hypothetical protein
MVTLVVDRIARTISLYLLYLLEKCRRLGPGRRVLLVLFHFLNILIIIQAFCGGHGAILCIFSLAGFLVECIYTHASSESFCT